LRDRFTAHVIQSTKLIWITLATEAFATIRSPD
jgi:hypothetical protein